MTRIGLLSDTHSYLEEAVFHYFKDCDEIWHAGDVGETKVLDQLEDFKPLRVVYGNIDDHEVQIRSKEDLVFDVEGKTILMTHIAGRPPRYNERVKKLLSEHRPDILVCGHSHILKIMPDRENNLLFINPGAAGKHGFHKVKTLVRFDIDQERIGNMEVIELGKRGKLNN